MSLNRNPVIAVLAAATLLLSGCGMAGQLSGPAALKGGYVQAAAKKSEARPTANKDWKVVSGEVVKLLPDDLKGSRHQHFLVAVTPKKTIKIAHNIDLAPYVPVKVGDSVEIKCEYIISQPYDVAHWTHYDPRGGEGGYIKHKGIVYDEIK